MGAESEYALAAKGLSKSYWQGGQRLEVLKSVDFLVPRGARIAVTGVSGSGKSTLLHLLAGLDEADAGEVWVAGRSLAGLGASQLGALRNRHLGFVYQFHHLLPEFTALENVALPLRIGGAGKGEASQRARALLAAVGLEARQGHRPGQLSGGERQRVALARALVTEPDCLLADEPTGNLDEATASDMHDLIIRLSRDRGIACVVVTHSVELASRLDEQVRLHSGRLEQAPRSPGGPEAPGPGMDAAATPDAGRPEATKQGAGTAATPGTGQPAETGRDTGATT